MERWEKGECEKGRGRLKYEEKYNVNKTIVRWMGRREIYNFLTTRTSEKREREKTRNFELRELQIYSIIHNLKRIRKLLF